MVSRQQLGNTILNQFNPMTTPKHKIFLSFHSADMRWKDEFERLFHHSTEVIVSRAVKEGDISDQLKTETIRQKIRDEYLRESTVTIVLIGKETWQRKHVDWEVGSSLRHTSFNKRSGLIGIFLPDFPLPNNTYDPKIVLPRLIDNVDNGYAKLYKWNNDAETVKHWIHEAYLRKDKIIPDNSREAYGKNRTTNHW